MFTETQRDRYPFLTAFLEHHASKERPVTPDPFDSPRPYGTYVTGAGGLISLGDELARKITLECGPTAGCGRTFEATCGEPATCSHCGHEWGRAPVLYLGNADRVDVVAAAGPLPAPEQAIVDRQIAANPSPVGKTLSGPMLLAAMGLAVLADGPSIDQVMTAPSRKPKLVSSKVLSRYCACGARGPGGRLLKARECCLKAVA